MSGKTAITLKRQIAGSIANGNVGNRGLLLDDKDVLLLLRAAIAQEGSISAFAKHHGLERSQPNNMEGLDKSFTQRHHSFEGRANLRFLSHNKRMFDHHWQRLCPGVGD